MSVRPVVTTLRPSFRRAISGIWARVRVRMIECANCLNNPAQMGRKEAPGANTPGTYSTRTLPSLLAKTLYHRDDALLYIVRRTSHFATLRESVKQQLSLLIGWLLQTSRWHRKLLPVVFFFNFKLKFREISVIQNSDSNNYSIFMHHYLPSLRLFSKECV